jgi:hypothetical protein
VRFDASTTRMMVAEVTPTMVRSAPECHSRSFRALVAGAPMSRSLPFLPVLLLLGAYAGEVRQPTPAATATPTMTPYFVYVGTSTGDPTRGIHVLRFDPHDGSLARAPVPPVRILNPSFLTLAPDGRTVYAVSEVEDGVIAAFRRDVATGALTELGRRSSGGAGPAHAAVDATGRWLTVANYGRGSVAIDPAGGWLLVGNQRADKVPAPGRIHA